MRVSTMSDIPGPVPPQPRVPVRGGRRRRPMARNPPRLAAALALAAAGAAAWAALGPPGRDAFDPVAAARRHAEARNASASFERDLASGRTPPAVTLLRVARDLPDRDHVER